MFGNHRGDRLQTAQYKPQDDIKTCPITKQSFWVLACPFTGSERVTLQAHFLKLEMKRYTPPPVRFVFAVLETNISSWHQKVCKWFLISSDSESELLNNPSGKQEQDLR